MNNNRNWLLLAALLVVTILLWRRKTTDQPRPIQEIPLDSDRHSEQNKNWDSQVNTARYQWELMAGVL